ncbi:hypothetical protein HK102_001321 [Quaeritorhiza haematococci]|nr:hypothetical protein HK102_001321 [Quaeritorhiza haematococci]
MSEHLRPGGEVTVVTPPNRTSSISAKTKLPGTLQPVSQQLQPVDSVPIASKNLGRLVSRVGPLVVLVDHVIEILTWRNPPKTLVWVMFYIFLCLYPTLWIVVPQIGSTYYILRKYYQRAKSDSSPKPTPLTPTQQARNLAFIHTFLARWADTHDYISEKLKVLDWSDEEETMRVLKNVVLSMFGILFLARLVPVNYLMLVGGLGMFLQNTTWFQAASTTVSPVLMKNFQSGGNTMRGAVAVANSRVQSEGNSGSNSDSTVAVTLFENQRWWAASAFRTRSME